MACSSKNFTFLLYIKIFIRTNSKIVKITFCLDVGFLIIPYQLSTWKQHSWQSSSLLIWPFPSTTAKKASSFLRPARKNAGRSLSHLFLWTACLPAGLRVLCALTMGDIVKWWWPGGLVRLSGHFSLQKVHFFHAAWQRPSLLFMSPALVGCWRTRATPNSVSEKRRWTDIVWSPDIVDQRTFVLSKIAFFVRKQFCC